MEHGSLKSGLLIIPKREAPGNTIYDATSTLSVTVYFDATRPLYWFGRLVTPYLLDIF